MLTVVMIAADKPDVDLNVPRASMCDFGRADGLNRRTDRRTNVAERSGNSTEAEIYSVGCPHSEYRTDTLLDPVPARTRQPRECSGWCGADDLRRGAAASCGGQNTRITGIFEWVRRLIRARRVHLREASAGIGASLQ